MEKDFIKRNSINNNFFVCLLLLRIGEGNSFGDSVLSGFKFLISGEIKNRKSKAQVGVYFKLKADFSE